MNAAVVVGIAAWCIGTSAAIWSSVITMRMVGEVNRKRPFHDQISYFWWALPKFLRVSKEYRKHYPEGKLIRDFWIAGVLLMLSWGVGMIALFSVARS